MDKLKEFHKWLNKTHHMTMPYEIPNWLYWISNFGAIIVMLWLFYLFLTGIYGLIK